ncbi:hypothetical protein BG011_002157 [Mortierella polycephala]|uniref:Yeast cell wall synthesis Kre9/Knh1-like N-terminal domain-containing protein n=1 Tax=Mortierella polycephala TaxID=41804 RepID=A0A9P6Q843_9FUNG|nr:hypothetical protein BG011_002157 [Mortierella polycephala]
MKFTATLAVLSTVASMAAAFVAPVDPWGETVWTPNTKVQITWKEDDVAPLLSTNPIVDIFLATGSDQVQTSLEPIATKVDAGKVTSVEYTVPTVSPAGKIYFLYIVSDKGDKAWSTRFTITDASGNPGTLKPSGPVGQNPGGNGTIVSPGAGAAPSVSGSAAPTGSATVSGSPSTTSAGAKPSGAAPDADKDNAAGSIGASVLSVAAAAVLGAAAMVAF